jgi:signal transduction histidine kinase
MQCFRGEESALPHQIDEMPLLIYLRLIGFTTGTLLQLFWMVVILGYRRQRNFERVFFFLCLALFLFYGGSLLALNAGIHYTEPPALLVSFAKTVLCAGLCVLPTLLIHLDFEYASLIGLWSGAGWSRAKRVLVLASYAPIVYFALRVYPTLAASPSFDSLTPGNALGRGYGLWLGTALLVSLAWEVCFIRRAPDRSQRSFHFLLAVVLLAAASITVWLYLLGAPGSHGKVIIAAVSLALALIGLLPSSVLIYFLHRHNFLLVGRQNNLLYAVSATFLALLYLSLVRRVSGWLEPVLPPEATAAILLFVLVIFMEPLQRFLGRRLQEAAQRATEDAHRLVAEIQQQARLGDTPKLISFIDTRAREQFKFADVHLVCSGDVMSPHSASPAKSQGVMTPSPHSAREQFPIVQAGHEIGRLYVQPHGAMITGEIRASLEFLCEQLPGALDLCRLIEEKLRLERELAERERLAVLGQMAASISHNLKNPLGSIKTILQVQLEDPSLPPTLRGETELVLGEISRLSAKLNQLLQFSRPAVIGSPGPRTCNAQSVLEEVVGVLRHEAEKRGITLTSGVGPPAGTGFNSQSATLPISSEALNDIISNLVLNALEAAPRGGRVSIALKTRAEGGLAGTLAGDASACVLTVDDDGPGISAAAAEKLFQPFFTTKPQGTGLGLAIVARRVTEARGTLDWESPTHDGRGTRFRVTLPLHKEEH